MKSCAVRRGIYVAVEGEKSATARQLLNMSL